MVEEFCKVCGKKVDNLNSITIMGKGDGSGVYCKKCGYYYLNEEKRKHSFICDCCKKEIKGKYQNVLIFGADRDGNDLMNWKREVELCDKCESKILKIIDKGELC